MGQMYYYEKCQIDDEYYNESGWQGEESWEGASEGRTDWAFSTSTGLYVYGSLVSSGAGVTLYIKISPNWIQKYVYTSTTDATRWSKTCGVRDAQGDFIEMVVGELGDYPADGTQGGYWYVRKGKVMDGFMGINL